MTRIVAGTAKSRTLKVPPVGTRPTSARVRESLFGRLDNWNIVQGARVLDLFAGSGALGLESLSRGARHAVFVDQSGKAIQVVKENIVHLGFQSTSNCRVEGAQQFIEANDQQFDLIFVDPPYEWTDQQMATLLNTLESRLDEAGMIVVERSSQSGAPPLPDNLLVESNRAWGDTTAWFIGKPEKSA